MKIRSIAFENHAPLRVLLYAALFLLLTGLMTLGIKQALTNNVLGSDFYVFWRAGNAFFLEGSSPYSEDLTHEIQIAIYHRLARPDEDPMQFSYPAYALVMVIPFFFMPFDWAQAAWMAFNLASILTIAFVLFPKTPVWILATLPLAYNILYGAGVGNFSLVISLILFLFFGYFVVLQGRARAAQIAVGILLAWSTTKPQSVWLYLAFALLFCFRQRLWPLLITFAAGVGALALVPFFIQTGWLADWISSISRYVTYTGQNRGIVALLALFYPGPFSVELVNRAFQLAAVILLLAAGFLFYRWWQGRLSDFNLLAWVALITYLLLPNNSSADQMFLLLPVLLWILEHSPQRISARWLWLIFLVYSYLVFFAQLFGLVTYAVVSGQLIFFAAWAAWAWFIKKFRNRRGLPVPVNDNLG
jgi:hypothetical protein